MADITPTAASMRPLGGAVIRRFNAGGSGNVGDTVYIAADGDVEQADASSAGTTYAVGVVVAVAGKDVTAFVAGNALDVVIWGPVTGFAAMTPNDVLYQSNTAARMGEAAGDSSHKIGRALTASTVFINPPLTEA